MREWGLLRYPETPMNISNLEVPRFLPVFTCVCSLYFGAVCVDAEGLPRLGESALLEDKAMGEHYRRLWEGGLDSPADVFRLGQFYHANAFLSEAARCYALVEDANDAAVSERAAYLLACVREEQGCSGEAIVCLETLLGEGLDYPQARLRLARLKEASGEDATELLEACLVDARTFAGAAITLAKKAMRRGDRREAERRLLGCLERDPWCGDAALLLANVYAAAGEDAKAERYLEQGQGAPRHTSALDPWLDEILLYRFGEYRLSCDADELFTALRFEEAREVLKRGLRLYPESGDLWVGLAKLEFASDRRGYGFEAIERAVSCPGAPRQAFTIYADELYREGDYDEAIAFCARARRGGVELARLALVEADCWRAVSQPEKARSVLDRALERNRFNAWLLEASGDLAREEGRLELAVSQFREALRGRPMEGGLYAKLLACSIECRDWTQAEWAVDSISGRLPGEEALPRLRSQYWLARALDFQERGEREEWLGALGKAFESDAASEQLFRQVSARLLEGEEWSVLSRMASEAAAHLPESHFVRKIEGVSLLQQERFDEGLESLEAARALALAQGALLEARRLAALIEQLSGEADSV